jgi:hypothetical protein
VSVPLIRRSETSGSALVKKVVFERHAALR